MSHLQQASIRRSRRSILQAAVTAAGALTLSELLSACSERPTTSPSTVNLVYWDWLIAQAPWVNNEIRLFEKSHPHIKIRKVTQGTGLYDTLFALAIKGNQVPDIFMIPETPMMNKQIAKGWLLPVDRWADHAWKARFPTGALQEGSNIFNGKLYTAPLSGMAPGLLLYINNAVFKQAGLVNRDGSVLVPQTWDDVTHAAESIQKKSNGTVYGFGFGNVGFSVLSWWMDVFIRGAGSVGGAGNTFGLFGNLDYRVGKYTYATDRNYADCIDLFLDWKRRNYFYPDSLSVSDEVARVFFEQGKFGMIVGGVWNQAEWTSHHFTDYSLTTLVSPTTIPAGYFYHTNGGSFFGISAKTQHPEEAWAWFDWLYSPETGKRWVQMGEDLSVYPQNNDPALVTLAPFRQYIGMTNYTLAGPDPSIRNPETAHVLLTPMKPDIGDVLTGIYTGQIADSSEALSALANRSQNILSDSITLAQQQGYNVSINDFIFPDWDILQPYITRSV
ncbi:ABC transporter substrate-binding protein [Tengunoibacter tsumagoiensis]|uniref:Sugar ABC transporter substrate-binding protein n=1 Tax=Tengunoibacter tsumagoiensis TaxID=2014871 RepID=A0A402A806_9CHLR|nr:extracellular solute-binding protein [Tengunoibacter tsumagoiensis]GCE15135.1 hypothetical protein KTT_49940 [Tengunoibacter tsumagoiensis]